MEYRSAVCAAAAVAAVAPLGVFTAAVWRTHRFAQRSINSPITPAQTVVVFGTLALPDRPGRVLQARLDHAIGLYRRGHVRRFAVAGGAPAFQDWPFGGHDEVTVGLAYASDQGVAAEDLIAIRPGQNTREQVACTKQLVADAGLGPIVAVSSAYHMRRISSEARRRGYQVQSSAPSDSVDTPTLRLYASHILVDAIALIWYALPPGVTRRVNTAAGSFRHMALLAMTGDVSWRLAWRSLRGIGQQGEQSGHTTGETAGPPESA